MLENLNYIYIAMYVLDLRDVLANMFVLFGLFALFGVLVWFLFAGFHYEVYKDFRAITYHIKKFIALVFFCIFCLVFAAIIPSANTVKAYIGVKAVQCVGNYLSEDTNIPQRSRATITKLWDRVDAYIGTIGEDDGSNGSKVKKEEKPSESSAIDKKYLDSIVSEAKKQALDSLVSTIKK